MKSHILMMSAGLALVMATACAGETGAESGKVQSVTVTADENNTAARLVQWTTEPEGAEVSVAVSSPRPGENIDMASDGTADGALVYTPGENARRYFTVDSGEGEPVTAALRVLPLEGGRNFRDLGGYETEDGRTVKWGLVYRSGVLADLTDTDYDFISGLDIETVVDFRSTDERAHEPTDWRAGEVDILTWDYDSAGGEEFMEVFQKPDLKPEDVTAMMTRLYFTLVEDHADKYAVMFDRLITSDAPLAFHCTAGKDRTGVGAALVLTALGVPRETIIEDYALSEQVVDYMTEMAPSEEELADSPYAFLAKLPPELVSPLMRSDPAYIKAVLDHLDEEYGSVLAFIQTELGVDDQELEALRSRLLQ